MYKQALFLVVLVFLSTLVRSQPVKPAAETKTATDEAKAADKTADDAATTGDAGNAAEGDAEPAEGTEPVADAGDSEGGEVAGDNGGPHPAEDKIDEAIQVMNKLNDLFESIVKNLNSAGDSAAVVQADEPAAGAGDEAEGDEAGGEAATGDATGTDDAPQTADDGAKAVEVAEPAAPEPKDGASGAKAEAVKESESNANEENAKEEGEVKEEDSE